MYVLARRWQIQKNKLIAGSLIEAKLARVKRLAAGSGFNHRRIEANVGRK